jgi:hypothetical protein
LETIGYAIKDYSREVEPVLPVVRFARWFVSVSPADAETVLTKQEENYALIKH